MPRQDEPFDQSPGLAVLKDVLRHQRLTIAIVTVVVLGASLAFSFSRTPVYTASASVFVTSPPDVTLPPNMDTERKLASSTVVAGEVAGKDGLTRNVKDVLQPLSVSVPVGTDILVFSYSDPDSHLAQRGAQDFAEAYLAFRKQQYVGQIGATNVSLTAQIAYLKGQLKKLEDRVAHGAAPITTAAEASTYTALLASAEQRLAALTPANAVNAGDVVDAAALPISPSSPSHPVDGVLGLALGLLLGVFAGWLRERRDDSVRDTQDVESILRAPVIGAVPSGNLFAALRTPYDDSIRAAPHVRKVLGRLRTDVMLSIIEGNVKSVLVTRCAADSAPVAAALAILLARGGQSVVVVSADAEDRALDKLFGTEKQVGLTEVLSGDDVAGVLRPGPEPGIKILPAGSHDPSKAGLLVSKTMTTLIRELERLADVVLINVGSVAKTSEVGIVAAMADASLVVVGPSASRTELGEMHGMLTHDDRAPLGAVLIDRHLKPLPSFGFSGSSPVAPRSAPTMEVAS